MIRVAIAIFGRRVAPTFLHCEAVQLVGVLTGKTASLEVLNTNGMTEEERIRLLEEHGVGTLVCGGVDCELAAELSVRGIQVIKNVAGEIVEVLEVLAHGTLRPGFGISHHRKSSAGETEQEGLKGNENTERKSNFDLVNCIECKQRLCVETGKCSNGTKAVQANALELHQATLEVAMDIASEPERNLCRIAELVYFCLGMKYDTVGLAFCADMFAEAETVFRLLQRFMKVVPVCCRFGGSARDDDGSSEGFSSTHCNPVAMAQRLNEAKTKLNVLIGLGMGSDVVFTQLSLAPVTTLFVKDRLLANNPVAAVHSRYVLERIIGP